MIKLCAILVLPANDLLGRHARHGPAGLQRFRTLWMERCPIVGRAIHASIVGRLDHAPTGHYIFVVLGRLLPPDTRYDGMRRISVVEWTNRSARSIGHPNIFAFDRSEGHPPLLRAYLEATPSLPAGFWDSPRPIPPRRALAQRSDVRRTGGQRGLVLS
jgi:hypothetical protein